VNTAAARIGPNAITRVAQALTHQCGQAATARLFGLAGLDAYLEQPPQQMVDENEARRLHALLHHQLGADGAARVASEAGTATADYLLAHRIPNAVQALLRVLPAPLAARVLLKAITRHAWTFAGSGRFEAAAGRPVRLTIVDNPLCRGLHTEAPACAYYAATFERLFRALVKPHARVAEVSCEARGDDACRFEVRW
jgi:divinyl protochlorophyllide a 8-vinyl-reductase